MSADKLNLESAHKVLQITGPNISIRVDPVMLELLKC